MMQTFAFQASYFTFMISLAMQNGGLEIRTPIIGGDSTMYQHPPESKQVLSNQSAFQETFWHLLVLLRFYFPGGKCPANHNKGKSLRAVMMALNRNQSYKELERRSKMNDKTIMLDQTIRHF